MPLDRGVTGQFPWPSSADHQDGNCTYLASKVGHVWDLFTLEISLSGCSAEAISTHLVRKHLIHRLLLQDSLTCCRALTVV